MTFRTLALGMAAAAAVAAGCGKKQPVLHLYTWADCVKPELVQRFEQENGCRVVIDTFDANEAMYAKLKAGATGYDLITPSSYMVKTLNDQGMLRELSRPLIPNIVHVDPNCLSMTDDKAAE